MIFFLLMFVFAICVSCFVCFIQFKEKVFSKLHFIVFQVVLFLFADVNIKLANLLQN